MLTVFELTKDNNYLKKSELIDEKITSTASTIEFSYCGLDSNNATFSQTPEAIVNINIDGHYYEGLKFNTMVSGEAYCLKNDNSRTRVNLGKGTQFGSQIYFHQLVNLYNNIYHCNLGGQRWMNSSTVILDQNGLAISSEFNKFIKPIIK